MSIRESVLLSHIYAASGASSHRVAIGPGDDMGAVRLGDTSVLVTVDQVADGVHFDLKTTPLERVGRKAITRNLSDVAAMAALPVGAVAAACLPRDFGEDRAKRLFDIMREVAAAYGCPLVGGDISVWDHPLILTVTVLAEPAGIEPVRRSGARVGDVVCVTGAVGGAWTSGGGRGDLEHVPHLDFEPRLAVARELAQCFKLHAMLDVSDGLATDLPRICAASGVGAELDVQTLPLRPEALRAAESDGKPAWMHGLCDGEDYELCFTLSPEDAARMPSTVAGVMVTRVGRIIERSAAPPSGVWLLDAGGRREMNEAGWEHGVGA